MNRNEMIKSLEQFSRNIEPEEGQVKVTRIPDYTTVYLEQIAGVGRSLFLNEYKIDGKTFWAGYSPRSETVFVSRMGRD